LHNVLAIFTFMGSSILRQDDAYSFQVISKIVDTIIPILVKVCIQHSQWDGCLMLLTIAHCFAIVILFRVQLILILLPYFVLFPGK
jgi:U3 small nucleolar RNA-associated protein 10